MLNLVQLQERLKDVPMQALMQYANGTNPQVPPFLALGELNRRKKMQEGAAADQAREMEGAPTVKQQIEQAAGLMALQGNRQRQAAQQQAGIQAALPMAAPNTTTSEPAQLAGGGFIDDIVVPRDYQAGGGVFDPEDLKRTMLRETVQGDVADIPKELMSAVARAALRRRPGVAGIPLPSNMFKRSDYASGGIVAFAGPEGSFVDPVGAAPYETDDMETRRKREELRRKFAGLASPLGMFTPVKPGQEREFQGKRSDIQNILSVLDRYNKDDLEKIDQLLTGSLQPGAEAIPTSSRSERENYSNEGRAYRSDSTAPRVQPSPLVVPKPRSEVLGIVRPDNRGIASIDKKPNVIEDAISRALGLDVSTLFEKPPKRTFDEILTEEKRRQGLAGISEEFLNKREQALADIQSRRERERAEQPMDRLMEMLAGIAEARGGTFGTQGAAGAKRAMILEREQRALREKQDMEMEDLKFTVAAKRDAIRRGDKNAAEALEEQERKQRFDIAKTQAERIERQGELASQEKYRTGSIEAQRRQAEATEGIRGEQSRANIENARTRALNEATDLIDKQIAALTTSGLPLNDKQKAQLAELQQKRDAIRAEVNAKYNAMLSGAGGSSEFKVIGVKPGGQ